MIRCANCVADLPPDVRFCRGCAAPVEREPEPANERKIATAALEDHAERIQIPDGGLYVSAGLVKQVAGE